MSRRPKISARVKAKRRYREVRALSRAYPKGSHHVKVGLPAGETNPYPDGTSVIDVGIWNEFGAPNIPERSFLRSAIRDGKGEYKALNRKNLKKMRDGNMTPEAAMGLLGTKAAGDVVARIDDISMPPNAPSTIARKGSADPLVDTGHLKQSITHQVVKR